MPSLASTTSWRWARWTRCGTGWACAFPKTSWSAGFDDIPEARRIPYQLTTVRQPIDQMVEATLSILHLDDATRPIERGLDHPITGNLIWRNTIPVPPAYRFSPNEETDTDAV